MISIQHLSTSAKPSFSVLNASRSQLAVHFPKYLFFLILLISVKGYGQCPGSTTPNYRTDNGAGLWTTAGNWNGGAPPYPVATINGKITVTIPTNQIVIIESANFSMPYSIVVDGKLILNGKLNMDAGTSITVNTGGVVCCSNTPCNASDRLSIGGNQVWSGNDGAQAGPKYSDGSSQLPIVLLSFTATPNKDNVEINWSTAIENNVSYFVIERSSNGKEFQEIGRVLSAGNSQLRKNYKEYDNSPLIGRSYYRLKEVDFDGYTEHFNMVVVDFAGKEGVSVYPNPYAGTEELSIALNFANEEQAYASITDIRGLQQAAFTFSGSSYKNLIKLNAGTYLLKVTSGGRNYVSRFVVK